MACMSPRVLFVSPSSTPALLRSLYIWPRCRVSKISPMAAGASAMSGGRMFHSISKSFPNLSVDSVRSSSISYRLQASPRSSSSEANDEKDFGDVRESRRKESMKDYVKKAEDQATTASEKAKQEAAGKAKEIAGAAQEKAAEIAEKTRETAATAKDKAKETAEKTRETGATAAKDKVKETAGEGAEKAREAAGKVADTAQSIGAKARQTVQGAWEAAKETTHKIKETVVGKDEDAAGGDVGRKHGREKL